MKITKAFAALAGAIAASCIVSLPGALRADEGASRPDVVVANFDGDSYGDWKAEGDALGSAPSKGTEPGQMTVSGFQGAGLVNTFKGGDKTTGSLTSPEIEITRNYVNFLIGGGGHPGLSFDLILDGKVVRHATGPNLVPGGSEALDWATWDVSELQGKKCVFRIVDNATGGWGHINVDEITLSDKKRAGMANIRELEVAAPFLLVPVCESDSVRSWWIRIEADGKVEHEFTARLALEGAAAGPGDFRASIDVRNLIGKKIRFIVEKADEDLEFAPLEFSNELYGGEESYNEKYRPQFHFSPRRGWTNDPNGLVYYDGKYHLFYQHNPFSVKWGNMTWGHATSPDLLHWTEQGDALVPDQLGTIFSGSGAVDWKNSTGFQTDPNEPAPLVFMYTYNGPNMRYGNRASQALAYSLDSGKTLVKYEGNPTLPHIVGGNRDPKIFWYEPTKRWIVALYMDGEDYALFESKDLKTWDELCRIEKLGCSECPDIFELPVDGNPEKTLWVFWGGNGKYLLGTFDGKTFKPEGKPLDAKWGGNDYAAQSYSDTPGRRIQFSWMSGGSYPGMPFNQQFTVPRELTLRSTPDGVLLCINPVKELETLRVQEIVAKETTTKDAILWTAKETPELLDAEAVVEFGDAKAFSVFLAGHEISFDVQAGTMKLSDVVAPCDFSAGKVRLRLVLDRTSLEIFANGGLSQIAKCFVPEDGRNESPVFEIRGAGVKGDVKVWKLTGVWNQSR